MTADGAHRRATGVQAHAVKLIDTVDVLVSQVNDPAAIWSKLEIPNVTAADQWRVKFDVGSSAERS